MAVSGFQVTSLSAIVRLFFEVCLRVRLHLVIFCVERMLNLGFSNPWCWNWGQRWAIPFKVLNGWLKSAAKRLWIWQFGTSIRLISVYLLADFEVETKLWRQSIQMSYGPWPFPWKMALAFRGKQSETCPLHLKGTKINRFTMKANRLCPSQISPDVKALQAQGESVIERMYS